MAKNRKIRKVIRSKPTIEGAGVHLKRAFGFSETPQFDPFLLLDDFRSDDPRYYIRGFPVIRIAESKPSLMSFVEMWNTAIAWEIKASSHPETFSG